MLIAFVFAYLIPVLFGLPSSSSSASTFHPASTLVHKDVQSYGSHPAKAVSVPLHLAADSDTVRDLKLLYSRRRSIIVGSITDGNTVSTWSASIGAAGQWKDVDYTSGCNAQTAEWPASFHWNRILSMAAVYAGPLPGYEQLYQSPSLLKSINSGINFWFKNDFQNPACLYAGGTSDCPCGTPGLWNKNWFSSVILVPKLVARACILMNGTLSAAQLAGCRNVTTRAYNAFNIKIPGVQALTGANLLDVSSIGIDYATLFKDVNTLTEAYQRIHSEVSYPKNGAQDGIHADGSFLQHGGILYNGNYGKDYLNDVVAVEVPAAGTQFQAGSNTMKYLAILISGDTWMFVFNTVTQVLHWDLAVIGRFISYPVSDGLASANTHLNLTLIDSLGKLWHYNDITADMNGALQAAQSANAGNLKGVRNFPDADYIVSRGQGYVTSLKMYSTRTHGSECLNGENREGFHLADGALRTYIDGDEYEDIAAAMDWNLIPGITVDYGATDLTCQPGVPGLENFVGSAVSGDTAATAMRYTNPSNKELSFQKAWFFLDNDVQYVLVSSVTSQSSAPVYNVLDQRRRSGDIKVNSTTQNAGGTFASASTLWHGSVGYSFDGGAQLVVKQAQQTGNWSSISQSNAPLANVDMFTAYLEEGTKSLSYSIYPATYSDEQFQGKLSSSQITVLQNDAHISAIYDAKHDTIMAIFWDQKGSSLSIPNPNGGVAPFQLAANDASVVIYKISSNTLTVADPTQSLKDVGIQFTATGPGKTPWGTIGSGVVTANFPSGDGAGGSVASKVSVQYAQPTSNNNPSSSSAGTLRLSTNSLHALTFAVLFGFIPYIML